MAKAAPKPRDPRPPDGEALADLMGKSAAAWESLYRGIGEEFGPLDEKWSFSQKTGTWLLQLKQQRGKRTILYLSPRPTHFLASFVLGEKACKAAQAARLPEPLLEAIDSAPRYPEGRGVRLTVRTKKEMEGVLLLARIKMAN